MAAVRAAFLTPCPLPPPALPLFLLRLRPPLSFFCRPAYPVPPLRVILRRNRRVAGGAFMKSFSTLFGTARSRRVCRSPKQGDFRTGWTGRFRSPSDRSRRPRGRGILENEDGSCRASRCVPSPAPTAYNFRLVCSMFMKHKHSRRGLPGRRGAGLQRILFAAAPFAIAVIQGCAGGPPAGTQAPTASPEIQAQRALYTPPTWEAVFLPPATRDTAAQAGLLRNEQAWDQRNDGVLTARAAPEPVLASNEWPDAPRPTLDRRSYLTLRQNDTYVFFRYERERDRGRRW